MLHKEQFSIFCVVSLETALFAVVELVVQMSYNSITKGQVLKLMEYIMRYPGAYFREAVDYIESLCDREFIMSW